MKYLIIGLLILIPFVSKAAYYGFSDGNFYDSSGTWQFLCFTDGNCYNASEILMGNKDALLDYSPTPITLQIPPSFSEPQSSNQSNNSQPNDLVAGGEPMNIPDQVTITPDPNFITTSIPATGTQVTLGQWVIGTNADTKVNINLTTLNFTGTIGTTEGINNLVLLDNGGQNTPTPMNLIGQNQMQTSLGMGFYLHNGDILTVQGNPNFSSSTQVSSVQVSDIQFTFTDNSTLSSSGTVLNLQ